MAKHMCSKTLYISWPSHTELKCEIANFHTILARKPWQQFHHVFTLNSTQHSHVILKGRWRTVRNTECIELLAKILEENKLLFWQHFNHISPLWYLKLLNIEYKGALTTISLFRLYTYPFKLLISQPFQNPPEW